MGFDETERKNGICEGEGNITSIKRYKILIFECSKYERFSSFFKIESTSSDEFYI